ncbi:type II CAAX endopeptidase family protein [Algisphaera agarilytica]|uniref:Membrane protease YdiL (CAAX protease family) n=1 Tax=Algisphaera agarilytica TaxID=1385975 RepID=A0A7X0LJG9_9BACT|nr:type II CAAX endopeptidase family protein [Algisphaera agarilytica]MBB6429345.1 membrane protease YdiL (CAAX protease family) [Algisphaera agarilytica]
MSTESPAVSETVSPQLSGKTPWLAVEMSAVFLVLPALIAFVPIKVPLIPLLVVMALTCLWLLRRDPSFDRRQLWNAKVIRRADLLFILGRFAVLAAVLAGLLQVCLGKEIWGLKFPPEMWMLPRYKPWIWVAVMVGYPIVSVLLQNVVWRAFFFHRYRSLFGTGVGMVAASAVAFGWVHVVMLNWFAVVATLVGGVMFAQTYRRSGSMLLSSIEHALYGCWVFTVGYGLMFLYGSLPPEAREMLRSAGG